MKRFLLFVNCFRTLGIFIYLIGSHAWAGNQKMSCPSEKNLTRNARITLVEAQKLMDENRSKEAARILSRFLAEYPDERHTYITYALAAFEMDAGNLSGAKMLYQESVELCPQFGAAWQNLGKVCFDLKDYASAARAFEFAWGICGKENPVLLFHAAVAHVKAENKQKALSHLMFFTRPEADLPRQDWVRLLAGLSMEEKQSPKALAVVEHLLKQEPQAYLYKLAATLYLDINHYEKAVTALAAYGGLTSLTVSEKTLMADLYYHIGIPYKAACIYEVILKTDGCRKICERAASAWYEAFEYERSFATIKTGLEKYPDSVPIRLVSMIKRKRRCVWRLNKNNTRNRPRI